MPEKFDPYHRWLAIPPQEQPPNHYRLLGLAKFESDVDVIDTAADRQMAHVRTYQSGKYADESQKLLNEISNARVVLLDPERRAAYDATLRETAKPLKQAAPLVTAQPLEAALSSPKPAPAIKTAPPTQVAISTKAATPTQVAAPTTPKVDASKLAPLLLAGGAGLLVLLLAAGAGAWLIFGGSQEQQVVVADPVLPPPPPPVLPPVVDPNDDVTPAPPILPPITVVDNGKPPVDDPTPEPEQPADPSYGPTDPLTPIEEPSPEEPPPSPIAALFAEAEVDEREAIPDEATQTGKREQVDALFSVSSARSAAQRADMAQKLLDTARDTKSDPAAQYVLFEMARDVAAGGGHVALAMEAIDELSAKFQVDGAALRSQSIAEAAPSVVQNAARSELVETGIQLVDELFAADKYVEAAKLIKALQSVAAKTRDKEQRTKLSAQLEQGSELFKGFKDAQAAIETLKKTPDDAAAALVAGKFYAFIKGDWQRGLVMLSLASDANLKSLAEKEMQPPRSNDERLALADDWLKQAGSAKGLQADRQRARAAMWFNKVQGGLTGLAKVEVQRKLEAIGQLGIDGGEPFKPAPAPTVIASTPVASGSNDAEETLPSRATRGKSVDLLAGLDLAKNIVRGDWQFQNGTLVSPPLRPLSSACLQIPADVPEEYDLDVEVTRIAKGDEFAIGMIYQGKQCNVSLDRHGMDDSELVTDRGSRSVSKIANALPEGARSRVCCAVRKDSIVVSANGREIVSYRGPADWSGMGFGWNTPDRNALMLGAWATVFHVHSFKLTPVGSDVAPSVEAGEAIDLLALVDVDKHAVQGKFERRGKSVICPEAGFARTVVPFHPPAEYQVTLDVTRKKGPFQGHDMGLGLIYQGKQCAVLIDRVTNTARGPASWSTISASGARNGGTVASITNDEQVLKQGRRTRIVCTVSKNGIDVVVDGKELLNYQGPAEWTGLDGPWGMPDPKALMLGGLNEQFEFHSLTLTPGTAAGAAATSGKSIDLLALVDTKKNAVFGDWRMVDGELVSPRIAAEARLQIPAKVPAEYDLNLEVTRNGNGNELSIGMIYQGKQCHVGIDRYSARSTDILGETNGSPPEVAKAAVASLLTPGERSRVKCAVRKDSITIFVNDKEIVAYRGRATWSGLNSGWAVPDKTALMLGAWWAEFRVHSFTLTPVGGDDDLAGGVVELLPLVDVKVDAQGKWQSSGDSLTSPADAETGIRLPYIPAQEYDLDLDIALASTTVDIELRLPYFGHHFMLHIDSSDDAKPGQPRPFRCEVRKTGLTIFHNGKQAAKVDRDSAKPLRDNTKSFEIITQNTPATFSRIRLTELGPGGRPLRGGAAPSNDGVVYLDDLQESKARAYGTGAIGKHGKTGLPNDGKDPADVKVGGKAPTHSLFAAADAHGISSIDYDLGGKHRRFRATAAIADRAHQFTFTGPLRFSVVGDGKILWTSAEFTRHGQTEAVDVDVTGVRKLELKGTCTTNNSVCAWCVWLEPQLTPGANAP